MKFVDEPPPTLQPEYSLGNAIRPAVRLMSTWKVEPASVPPSLPDAAEPQPEVEAPEASMTVSTVHATKRIPSALRAKSPEAVSATQVCMRVILSAAGSPDDFYDVSRPASPCVTRIGSGSGTDSDARALRSIAGGESSPLLRASGQLMERCAAWPV